jgi:hypothetical protein
MSESVEEGRNRTGIGEDGVPVLEGAICWDDKRGALVTAIDNLVEEVGCRGVVGEIAHLVNTKEMGPGIEAEFLSPEVWRIALQVRDEFGGGAEDDGVTGSNDAKAMFLVIMVLPRPLAPSRMRLRASSMKSRVNACSMIWRSMLFGQFQSKSAMGLNRPSLAWERRRSKLRLALSATSERVSSSRIWIGAQRFLVALAMKSFRLAAVTVNPK